MFNKVSVLVPTRHRVERLKVLLSSFAGSTRGGAELVFRVDSDDRETQDFLFPLARVGGCILVVGPRYRGYESMPSFFNELAEAATGDVFVCGNDDMVFKTEGWDSLVLYAANEYQDGLFDFGVSTHNAGNYPFSIVSRKAAERMGFLWDPRIFWGDIFLRDVMAHFGRSVPLPEVCIDHDWVGYAPDAVFLEGNSQRMMPRGEDYWGGVHRTAVREAVNKLEGLS